MKNGSSNGNDIKLCSFHANGANRVAKDSCVDFREYMVSVTDDNNQMKYVNVFVKINIETIIDQL